MGIFSSTNNFNDISNDDNYSGICGISERELHKFFDGEIGYLTIKSYEDGIYKLGFLNEEVADGFVSYLAVEFAGKSMNEWDTDIYNLRQVLRGGDVDAFMTRIQLIIS